LAEFKRAIQTEKQFTEGVGYFRKAFNFPVYAPVREITA
jgi:hypothetical protein